MQALLSPIPASVKSSKFHPPTFPGGSNVVQAKQTRQAGILVTFPVAGLQSLDQKS